VEPILPTVHARSLIARFAALSVLPLSFGTMQAGPAKVA
jgi:hypothetical protein